MKKNKKQWLNKVIFVDEYGRAPNLSDVPMTYMTRKKAYEKMKLKKEDIDNIWKEYKKYKEKE